MKKGMIKIRVGFGFDLHRFDKRKKNMILAGVKINCGFGMNAVSDGDLILHAICDGILGGASLGDIGDYFPPQSKSSKGIKSIDIVKKVLKLTVNKFKIINIDITIIAQKPRLVKHKRLMVVSLKKIFKGVDCNLKIKSKENTNILGGFDSIACFSLVTLEKC